MNKFFLFIFYSGHTHPTCSYSIPDSFNSELTYCSNYTNYNISPPCDYLTPPPSNYHSNYHPPHYYQYPTVPTYNNYSSPSNSKYTTDEDSAQYFAPVQELSPNPTYPVKIEKPLDRFQSPSPRPLVIVTTPSPENPTIIQNTSEHVQELDNLCHINEIKDEGFSNPVISSE